MRTPRWLADDGAGARARLLLALTAAACLHAVVWWGGLDEWLQARRITPELLRPTGTPIEVRWAKRLEPAAPAEVAPAVPAKAKPAGRRAQAQAAVAGERPASEPPPQRDVPEATSSLAGRPEARVDRDVAVPEPGEKVAAPASEPLAAQLASVEIAAPTAPASAAGALWPAGWPPATRLDYVLEGHWRGPIQGHAKVEWRRDGDRYEVDLDSGSGPLFSRRVRSTGRITPRGLRPERFDAEQVILLRGTSRWGIEFVDGHSVRMGRHHRPWMEGVQDEASQFVEITWRVARDPSLLRPGASFELPLVLPPQVRAWRYRVVGPETLHLPFGAVEAWHLRPEAPGTANDGTLAAEMWLAPSLQFLPVRIRLTQGAEVWMEMRLEEPPLQAAPG